MKELLFFILGMVVGGLVIMIMMSCLLAGRISEYESELQRLEQENNKKYDKE